METETRCGCLQVEDLSNELKSLKEQLRLAEGAATKEVEAAADMRRDFEIQMGNLETEVDKWKLLHESLYLQVNEVAWNVIECFV